VLVALALDGATPADRARLDASLGTPLDAGDVEDLRRIITSSGAAAQVEEVIAALSQRALDALDQAGFDDRARGVLTDLAAAATQRAH
jgi:geranylgeranyl diphosphate synthase type I